MTRIVRMTMQGFKSFAKRTEVEFTNGFNVVLGPNGSGKSNVIDGICFVLGRGSSKSLRAERSSNLIYNGGKTKEPAKQGEVSITFDNSSKIFPVSEPELRVTRIVKQNGNSIYKINNKTMTRQEILDILDHGRINPDGFNIVLQGDIVRFTEMPPLERRKIIEEIAGISVYEEKKEKAVKELEGVDGRLNDAELILKERSTYLKELKKERDQALKFKELHDKIDVNKASYLSLQIGRVKKTHEDLTHKVEVEEQKIAKINLSLKHHQEEIQTKKKEIDAISKEIEEKGEAEQVAVHREIEQIKVDLAKSNTRVDAIKLELEKVKNRKSHLLNDIEQVHQKISASMSEQETLKQEHSQSLALHMQMEESIAKFRQKHGIDNATAIEKELETIDTNSEKLQGEISLVRGEQQDLLRRKDQIDFQLQSLNDRLSKVREVEKEHQAQMKDLSNRKELFKKATLSLNTSLSEDSSLAAQIGNAKNKLSVLFEKSSSTRAKASAARDLVTGNAAVKEILDKKFPGVYGTVAELGKVPPKYQTALSVAAGNKLHSIVVDDDKIARDCIMHLKTTKLGVATFVPLNKIKSYDSPPQISSSGVHGLASSLVEYDLKFKKVFSYVFGGVVVVDSIDVARKIGIGSAKMVSLDGDIADITGAMVGGFYKRQSGFVASDAIKDYEEAESLALEQQHLCDILLKRRSENEEKIVRLRKEKSELEGEIIKLEKSLHLEAGDLDATFGTRETLEKELIDVNQKIVFVLQKISSCNKELSLVAMEKQKLKGRISELRNPRLIAELHTFEEKKAMLKKDQIAIDSTLQSLHVQVTMLTAESEKMKEIVKQHERESVAFLQEAEELRKKIKVDDVILDEKEKAAKAFYLKFKALFHERNAKNEEISKLESVTEKVREESRKAEITMNTFSLDHVRVRAELSSLEEQFLPYSKIEIIDKPEAELKSEIAKFERLVSIMGAVNLKSLEVYDAIEKEYEALLAKKESLHQEKEDVLLMINEIESKKNELFLQSFEVVNANFQKIFASLAKKGEASLVLEDPKNIFETGILIKVRLTGTRYMDIRSLSGGEKTLTALALIFAIQEHEPHSFYVMDEVDASLDKHNSELLAKLIRQYCNRAQYVVISHNDAMITEGDTLYGVSMNEHGMTTLTSLKV